MYRNFLRVLQKHLPKKGWELLGDQKINGLLGLFLFFFLFGTVRLMWWGGGDNLIFYTGDGDREFILTWLNLAPFNQWLCMVTADVTNFFTSVIFGQITDHYGQTVAISGGGGIWIHQSCAGNREIAIMLLVLLFIPGPWKQRVWFIPASLSAFFLINSFRLAHLAYLTTINMNTFQFWHLNGGKVISLFLFFVWVIWEKFFAEKYRMRIWSEVNAESLKQTEEYKA